MPAPTVAVLGGVVQDLTWITDYVPENGETVFATSFGKHLSSKGSNSAVAVHRLTRSNPAADVMSGLLC